MKKMYTRIVCLLVLGIGQAQAQEFTFSQAGVLRNAFNPARVADMPEDGRATLAYRNQWYAADQPYTSLFASAEGVYRLKSEKQLRRIGVQLSFANDNLARGALRTDWLQLAGSYTHNLDVARRHQLSGGLGFALQLRKLDATQLRFDNQFSDQLLSFDPGIASGESFVNGEQTFLQISLGAAYRFYVSDKFTFRTDVAFLGLNTLQESFSTLPRYEGYTQKRRLSATASARYQINDRVLVEPLVYYNRQGPAAEGLVGGWVLLSQGRYASRNMIIGPGIFIRPGDAIIPGVRFEYEKLTATFTYDATYSTARSTTVNNGMLGLGGLGALEISAQYRFWFRRPADGPRSIPCRTF